MDLSRALADLAEIRRHIAKGEIYRGYRPVPVAASGLIGIAAAWLEKPGLGPDNPVGFVLYWSLVAMLAGLVGTSEIIHNYVVHDNAVERRQTRRVIGQFLPSVLGGAIITGSFVRLNPALVPLLPGVWAICFGLGTFASRPYLPRASMIVAFLYYAAGVALLWNARVEALNGWWVGGTFGAGQLVAAIVLYSDRRHAAVRRSAVGGFLSDDEHDETKED